MTRELGVLRHAKSSWSHDVSDHARPLNPRGRRDAVRVGLELRRRAWIPDLILTSDSERTQETLAFLLDRLEAEPPTRVLPSLYLPGLGDMLGAVAEAPAEARRVLLVSHNPGCEELVQRLSGQRVTVKTAHLWLLQAEGSSWGNLVMGPGRLTLVEQLRGRTLPPAPDEA